jgi:hypothetical protein
MSTHHYDVPLKDHVFPFPTEALLVLCQEIKVLIPHIKMHLGVDIFLPCGP